MHHNRHKEILKILRQISLLDADRVVPGLALGNTLSGSRGRRKKLKKTGNTVAKAKGFIESFPKDELDFVSEALHLTVHESKGAWEGTYIYDHKQENIDINSTKSTNYDEQDLAPDFDMTTVPFRDLAVKPPADMTPRQRKTLKKFSTPINHSSFGGGSKKFSPMLQETDPLDGVDPAIFFRLGVEIITPIKNSKARKDLTAKLVAAVKDDLEIIVREDREIEMREAGFWRWAGRTAWHAMKDTRKTLDWATGQKINVPRTDEFTDDMYINLSGQDTKGQKTPNFQSQEAQTQCPKRDPGVELSPSPSLDWKFVESKKSVASKNLVQGTKTTFTDFGSAKRFELLEEEKIVDNDIDQIITSYQKQIVGEQNIGAAGSSKPDSRKGGRRLNLKHN